MEIKGLTKVVEQLRARGTKLGSTQSAVVGYTAAYALYVHENVEMKWRGVPRKGIKGKGSYWDPPGRGQSKFLEQPARTEQQAIVEMVREDLADGKTWGQALSTAALYLQRCSMLLAPVDTGNLKASAFTRLED